MSKDTSGFQFQLFYTTDYHANKTNRRKIKKKQRIGDIFRTELKAKQNIHHMIANYTYKKT